MRFLPFFFQVLLYRGSHIPVQRYTPLLDSLRVRFRDLNITSVATRDYSMFGKPASFSEPTVLIGHSFGGYFALLDAKEDQKHSNNIKGVVLLNSHFNSRRTNWYSAVPQADVVTPTLTIAGAKDKALPLKHVLSDLWEKVDERLPNKFYKIYPDFSHFSGLSGMENEDTETIAEDIEVLVRSVYGNDLKPVKERCLPSEKNFSYSLLSSMVPRGRDWTNSVSLVDGLLKIVLPPYLWKWLHHVVFVTQKPTPYENVVFTDNGDHILIKACNLSLHEVTTLCRLSIPETYKTRFKITKVSSTMFGVYQWLLCPLRVRTDNKGISEWPIVHLPVKENVDYYKVLHPRQLLLKSLTEREVRD